SALKIHSRNSYPDPKAATPKSPSPHSKTLTRWRQLLTGSCPDARPMLEVEAFHGTSACCRHLAGRRSPALPTRRRQHVAGMHGFFAKVHGPDARPLLEVEALHEPQ